MLFQVDDGNNEILLTYVRQYIIQALILLLSRFCLFDIYSYIYKLGVSF